MITGFFYDSMLKGGRLEKHIIKILRLLIISNIAYVVFYAVMICSGVDVGRDHLIRMNLFSIKAWFHIVFLNEQIIASHLWYLLAVLYDLLAFAFISRLIEKNKRWEFFLGIFVSVLLLLYPLLSTYSEILFERKIARRWVENFIIPGFPYMFIGYEIKKYYKTLLNIRWRMVSVLYGMLWIFQLLEVKVINTNDRNAYLMTIFVSTGTFITAVKYSMIQRKKSKILDMLVNIGKKHSTNIYIYHVMIFTILLKFFNMVGFHHLDDFILKGWEIPALTFVIGTILSAAGLTNKKSGGRYRF